LIKSDKWIRRMALEHRMIEPFEPGQIRAVNGHKIVSYGTSSYGYDIRCSDDFKIFTNINSTIVDPKAFDEKSFVDFKGDICIIPPNSFALARTVPGTEGRDAAQDLAQRARPPRLRHRPRARVLLLATLVDPVDRLDGMTLEKSSHRLA